MKKIKKDRELKTISTVIVTLRFFIHKKIARHYEGDFEFEKLSFNVLSP
jgi:hypothetical protein